MQTNAIESIWARRDRLKIFAEILEVAKGSQLKTRIMYKVNLSYTQVNEYLSFLTKKGFLRVYKKSRKKYYETTSKGKLYIENYMEMTNCLMPQELEVPMLIR